jgi:beta-lactamase regulating signal transducer with metallopeptidase domain
LLPPDLALQLTANQLTWVLLHELAHIRRADLVVALVQRVAQILYFFHPAVWLANWLIDQQREYACDDVALAACPFPRRDCGQGFLQIVERQFQPHCHRPRPRTLRWLFHLQDFYQEPTHANSRHTTFGPPRPLAH